MKIYKQIIFFFVFFFLSIYCYTQGNLFSKVINGVYDNIGVTNIISRPNKNFYLLGNNDPFVNDAIFIKMDSLGNPLLAKKFFTAFSSIPSNILINKAILTTDSGIFVIGLLPITINNTNFSRAFYAKLDLDGNILWHHTLTTPTIIYH